MQNGTPEISRGLALAFGSKVIANLEKILEDAPPWFVQQCVDKPGEYLVPWLKDSFNDGSTKYAILRLVRTVGIPPQTAFVAGDNFREGNAGIKYINDKFKAWYLGKFEEPVGPSAIVYSELRKSFSDGEVLSALDKNKETTLSVLFYLLSIQRASQPGSLLAGLNNVFYVRDTKGVLGPVSVRCSLSGWIIWAHDVGGHWMPGDRIFSLRPAL